MIKSFPRLIISICAVILACAALSFHPSIGSAAAQIAPHVLTIRALDGRNGLPIKGAHLLVFAGETGEQVRQHAQHFDLQTDQNGDAQLTLKSDLLKFVQVWIDGKTLCQSRPNYVSFSVEQAVVKGLLAPNTCSHLARPTEPGELLIFARPATLREKMAR